MFRCILRDEKGDLRMEAYGEDIYDCGLIWSEGASEVLKKGGSIEFNYVGPLQKCESAEGFI